jgi:hypothetical protein
VYRDLVWACRGPACAYRDRVWACTGRACFLHRLARANAWMKMSSADSGEQTVEAGAAEEGRRERVW